jgi:hypothetical protein
MPAEQEPRSSVPSFPDKNALLEQSQRESAPDQLRVPFGLYDPDPFEHARLSATELLREYDGTFQRGHYAIRVDITDQGEALPLLTRRAVAASSGLQYHRHEQADLRLVDGKWTHDGSTIREEDEQKLASIVTHVKQEWQEWQASGGQEDFRTWVGNQRVAQFNEQQGK